MRLFLRPTTHSIVTGRVTTRSFISVLNLDNSYTNRVMSSFNKYARSYVSIANGSGTEGHNNLKTPTKTPKKTPLKSIREDSPGSSPGYSPVAAKIGRGEIQNQSPTSSPSTLYLDTTSLNLDEVEMKNSRRGNGNFKRRADRMTVEGSPVCPSFGSNVDESRNRDWEQDGVCVKKVDTNATPAQFKHLFSPAVKSSCKPFQVQIQTDCSNAFNDALDMVTDEISSIEAFAGEDMPKTLPPQTTASVESEASHCHSMTTVESMAVSELQRGRTCSDTTPPPNPASVSLPKRKVLVISSVEASGNSPGMGHDTGAHHQENAKRTMLLSDDLAGCLKNRAQLEDSLLWIEDGRGFYSRGPAQSGLAQSPTSSPMTDMQNQLQRLQLGDMGIKGASLTSIVPPGFPLIHAASMADMLRVHEYAYIKHLEDKCKQSSAPPAESTVETGTETKVKRKTGNRGNHIPLPPTHYPSFYAPHNMLDIDTPLTIHSLEAARRFCGAAMLAVDCVMKPFPVPQPACNDQKWSNITRTFVLGRPPGHHAGPNGCVASEYYWKRPDMTSSGFCLLNTVGVAAAYARYTYGRSHMGYPSGMQLPFVASTGSTPLPNNTHSSSFRIAIVDIDVHHGNGTEEIVENLRPHTTYLPLPSSWAPVGMNSYKPWLDENDSQHVFFSSINLHAESNFYPCSGGDTEGLPVESEPASPEEAMRVRRLHQENQDNILNIGLTPVGPGPWDPKQRAKLSTSHRAELCYKASREMRAKVRSKLLPKLRDFQPHLLFISAGFDAHYDDMYHFLTEDDYYWLTKSLCDAANHYGASVHHTVDGELGGDGGHGYYYQGECRVVSVLEGGYSLSSMVPPLDPVSFTPTGSNSTAKLGSGSGVQKGKQSLSVPKSKPSTRTRSKANLNENVSVDAAESKVADDSVGGTSIQTYASAAAMNNNTGNTVAPVPAPSAAHATSKKSNKKTPAIPTNTATDECPNPYGIQVGDGGLVKGVLAHIKGLLAAE